jgi:hypothetical protein
VLEENILYETTDGNKCVFKIVNGEIINQ